MAKIIDTIIGFFLNKTLGVLFMIATSTSFLIILRKISPYLADPAILYLAVLFVIGLTLWIVNQLRNYSFNKQDKNFHKTFLQFEIVDRENTGKALIKIQNKKNIDYYNYSGLYYDVENNPIIFFSLTFIKPIYNKPKLTFAISGVGNAHAVSDYMSFYEEKGYIYNICVVVKNLSPNSVYSIEVKKNES